MIFKPAIAISRNGRDSQSMTPAVLELASQLQDKLKTLTVDHGKEFANYQTIERRTGTQVYFAHAYSPHERGSNENRNPALYSQEPSH